LLLLLLLLLQYGQGVFAPGIPMGDEGMYKCGHNLLRAHAKTYELYHKVRYFDVT
jgi:beta-glucosidase/6-phospho-beta-glucosidase/beta-galactosidase